MATDLWRQHRRLAGFLLIFAGYIVLAVGLIVLEGQNDDQLRHDARAACERLNVTRLVVLAQLKLDAAHATHDGRPADAAHYRRLRSHLVATIQPRDGLNRVDCRKAYP